MTISNSKSRGFTLIELIIVIVLLGILAITALPRFVDLSGDAHAATLQGVAGSMKSAKNLAYSKCLVSSDCNVNAPPATGNGLGNSIDAQGANITMAYGYPRHTPAGIARMINVADIDDGGEFVVTSYTSNGRDGLRIRPDANYSPNQCEVRYSHPQAAGEEPLIELDIDNC